MSGRLNSLKRYPLVILIGLFCLAELIIDPRGDFPLNDDWWYAHLYKKLFVEFSNDSLGWTSASAIGQFIITKPFVLLFGNSYIALRVFTLILSASSIAFFYRVLLHCKVKSRAAFLLTLVALFNPFFLCLSNSYMSEIPFIFFISGAVYFYLKFREGKSLLNFIACLLFFVLAILTRQVTLAFILGLLMAELLVDRKISFYTALLLLVPAAALFVLEWWLQSRVSNNLYTYLFFRYLPMQNKIPIVAVLFNFCKRWLHYISISGFSLFPLLIPYLVHYIRQNKNALINKQVIISLVLFIPVVIAFLKFPIGNYLYNVGIGPDTLYDAYILQLNRETFESPFLFMVIKAITIVSSFSMILLLVNMFFTFIKNFRDRLHFNLIFISFSLLFYYGLLCFSSAIFDRYILIFTHFFLVIISFEMLETIIKNKLVIFLLSIMGIFSILTTRDYLQHNKVKWDIVEHIKNNYNVTDVEINAGYEHEGHCFGDSSYWYHKWHNLPPNEYMVSRGPLEGYNKLGYKAYRRLIPFKMDTIFYLKQEP